MNETTGTRVDSLGRYHLAEGGTAVDSATGKNRDAAQFNAATEYFTNTDLDFKTYNGFSFSFWVRRPSQPTAGASVGFDYCTPGSPAWTVSIFDPGRTNFTVRNSVSALQQAYTDAGNGWTSDWVHVVCTWSDGDKVRIYTDGALDKESAGTLAGPMFDGTGNGLIIGIQADEVTGPFSGGNSGWLDEIALFDFDIGLGGVQMIYNNGEGLFL